MVTTKNCDSSLQTRLAPSWETRLPLGPPHTIPDSAAFGHSGTKSLAPPSPTGATVGT